MEMRMILDISISIVNFNSFNYLLGCIKAVLEHCGDLNIEILVVDNASEYFDSSRIYSICPDALLTLNGCNMGFAYAQNQNFQLSNGSYFFLLNPDVLITSGSLQEIVRVFKEHKDVGIVTPSLTLSHCRHYRTHKEQPTIQSALHELLSINPLVNHFKKQPLYDIHKPLDSYINVDCINGAAFAVRSDAYRLLHGLDEQFFMYFEEMDFCKRIRDTLGMKIALLNNVHVHHLYGRSSINTTVRQTAYYESYVKYFKKHHGIISSMVIRAFISIGEIVRILAFQVKYFPFTKGWRTYLSKMLGSSRLILWAVGFRSKL
jgi:GT2 family glycosyltransferase